MALDTSKHPLRPRVVRWLPLRGEQSLRGLVGLGEANEGLEFGELPEESGLHRAGPWRSVLGTAREGGNLGRKRWGLKTRKTIDDLQSFVENHPWNPPHGTSLCVSMGFRPDC